MSTALAHRVVKTIHFMGPMSVDDIKELFDRASNAPSRPEIRKALSSLATSAIVRRAKRSVYELTPSGTEFAGDLLLRSECSG